MSPALQRFFLALCVSFLGAAPALAADQTWREVRSPHFRVLTNGSEKDGRTVAFEFEQMRHVFVMLFRNENIGSGAPLTIVAARDGATLHNLEPYLSNAQVERIAGEFHRGWEKQFALARLDTWTNQNQVVIYHEYTHSILHANTHWLPTWLDEGLAEFYGYTRFESNRTLVGAPSARMQVLQRRTPLPVLTILSVDQHSHYYRDEYEAQLFYAQSWAMVHFCMFGPGMENGQKLMQFMHKLQDQEPQEKAFREAFGDPKAFDAALSLYLGRYLFTAGVLPPDQKLDAKSFSARQLTPAETDYELGCFHIGTGDRAAGRALLQQAVELDPKLAGAHEELGYAAFEAGKDAAAVDQWKQAVALDPTLARSQYALLMMGKPIATQTDDELRGTQSALRHITTLAPSFAPTYVELALVEWRLHMIQQAYADARKAETLEPWRAGYRLLTARILLNGNQPVVAANYTRYVASHWFGPDHDEAVDLWNDLPPENRGEGPAPALDIPAGAQTVRGTLTDITCATSPGDAKLTVTLQPAQPADAKPLRFVSDGKLMSGWSDTLWFGSDHFSLCHHLAGYPVFAAYTPDANGGAHLLDLEIRENLPPTQRTDAPSGVQAAAPPSHTAAPTSTMTPTAATTSP